LPFPRDDVSLCWRLDLRPSPLTGSARRNQLLVPAALPSSVAVLFFHVVAGVDESRDDQASVTTYRGVVITRHPPMMFRNKRGKKLSLVTCSFSVSGVAMAAESMAKARKLIDEALGPES
jgi:hypothetical protein